MAKPHVIHAYAPARRRKDGCRRSERLKAVREETSDGET